jgi:hypothetical protein
VATMGQRFRCLMNLHVSYTRVSRLRQVRGNADITYSARQRRLLLPDPVKTTLSLHSA